LVRAALSGGILDLAIPPASAQHKVPQAEAEYQDRPKYGLTCAACSLFRKPRSCEIVEGDISPNGWCKFFDLPDLSSAIGAREFSSMRTRSADRC
jgi:hypothetical protein